MPNRPRPKPLDAFPAIRSANVVEIEHALFKTYGARRFDVTGKCSALNVHANHWQSRGIAISYCSYGERVEVGFPEATFYRQQFAIRGRSEIKIGGLCRQVDANTFCVVPPEQTLHIDFRPGFEQLVIRIERDYLTSKLTALMGDVPSHVEFEARPHSGGLAMERFRRRLYFYMAELDRNERLSDLETSEIEQALAISFLHANPHNYEFPIRTSKTFLDGRVIKCLYDYIHAHWDNPLTVEAISQATGIGVRSIFYHFRREFGRTPMQIVKDLRLRHARKMLMTSPEKNVTEVALDCGFGNLGHFASDYRKLWGESPSETRRGSKSKS